MNITLRLFLISCALISFQSCFPPAASTVHRVCFQKCVNVEVVQKPDEITRGLQFRQHLGKDDGMLFIFSTSQPYSFWMKDTLIPLDMIWMDYARRVIHIASSVPPCVGDPCPTYAPQGSALYVLEVNSGYARQHNIKIGDTAQFHLGMIE